MSDGGKIAGSIAPGPDGGKPVFTIIRREQQDAGPNVRPCDHPEFVLDERWNTVTCGRCGERVDAFAALLHYAKWWEGLEHQRKMNEHAEKNLQVAELRRLSRLRAVTEAEREELRAAIARQWTASVQELRDLGSRVGRAVSNRRFETLQAKCAAREGACV